MCQVDLKAWQAQGQRDWGPPSVTPALGPRLHHGGVSALRRFLARASPPHRLSLQCPLILTTCPISSASCAVRVCAKCLLYIMMLFKTKTTALSPEPHAGCVPQLAWPHRWSLQHGRDGDPHKRGPPVSSACVSPVNPACSLVQHLERITRRLESQVGTASEASGCPLLSPLHSLPAQVGSPRPPRVAQWLSSQLMESVPPAAGHPARATLFSN